MSHQEHFFLEYMTAVFTSSKSSVKKVHFFYKNTHPSLMAATGTYLRRLHFPYLFFFFIWLVAFSAIWTHIFDILFPEIHQSVSPSGIKSESTMCFHSYDFLWKVASYSKWTSTAILDSSTLYFLWFWSNKEVLQ